MRKIILLILLFLSISVFAYGYDSNFQLPGLKFSVPRSRVSGQSLTNDISLVEESKDNKKAVSTYNTDKKDMDEMLALKTQVWARELNRQYKYLEATVNRFQMQVQKAIARAETVNSEETSSYSSESNSSQEAFNEKELDLYCRSYLELNTKLDCYQNSLSYISGYVKDGTAPSAKIGNNLKKLCNSVNTIIGGVSCDSCTKKEASTNCIDALSNGIIKYKNDQSKSKSGQPSGGDR